MSLFEKIQKKAYEIYRDTGNNNSIENWLMAEKFVEKNLYDKLDNLKYINNEQHILISQTNRKNENNRFSNIYELKINQVTYYVLASDKKSAKKYFQSSKDLFTKSKYLTNLEYNNYIDNNIKQNNNINKLNNNIGIIFN